MPVVLFSGGEPLMRPDLFELVDWTVAHGMRAVISTNGTLIDRESGPAVAATWACPTWASAWTAPRPPTTASGAQPGAFAAAMAGVRHCQEVGLKVGLRFTVSRLNYQEVPAIFDLVEEY